MSDFIYYKDQRPVNLDKVMSFHSTNDAGGSYIRFHFGSMCFEDWEFETEEEAKQVFTHLVQTSGTSISDELFMGIEA